LGILNFFEEGGAVESLLRALVGRTAIKGAALPTGISPDSPEGRRLSREAGSTLRSHNNNMINKNNVIRLGPSSIAEEQRHIERFKQLWLKDCENWWFSPFSP
jgi:hypothetical protein